MVIQIKDNIDNKGTYIVNNLKDCLELVPEDLAEAITHFNDELKNGDDTLQYKYECLEREFNSYESTVESQGFCLSDVLEIAESLINDIEDSKRLNRDEIIKSLRRITTRIINEI